MTPMHKNKRTIIVSNRLPMTITTSSQNGENPHEISFKPSSGGLVSGLREIHSDKNSLWIGHCGIFVDDPAYETVRDHLYTKRFAPLPIKQEQYETYYNCFANGTIWPLFHYFPEKVHFNQSDWQAYQKVNELFAETILSLARSHDSIWIHDYHLMLLPHLLRTAMPNLQISYFHHIPFPSSEIFRILPDGKKLLHGLLGADLIGFHTLDYARHFFTCVTRFLGFDVDRDYIHAPGSDGHLHTVKVGAFPLGIDIEYTYKAAAQPPSKPIMPLLLEATKGRKVLLGIDRLDYTKGLPQRLIAFQQLLRQHSEYIGNLVFIQICVPSRGDVRDYKDLKSEVDRLVGEINGEFGRPGYVPLHYLYQPFSPDEVFSFYALGDIALVTPLRDGLNLVCKEFVACQTDNRGVLILSEFAGAAAEMGEALLVNPYDIDDLTTKMHEALSLSSEEETRRMAAMRERIISYNNLEWARDFMNTWKETTEKRDIMNKHPQFINKATESLILEKILSSSSCPLFLDYDGTLTPITHRPEQAVPQVRLLALLANLAKLNKIETIIITGRSRSFCQQYLSHLNISIIAEHGAFIRRKDRLQWEPFLPTSDISLAKETFLPELERFTRRVPGSFIEHKETSTVLHYRQAEPLFARFQALELKEVLNQTLAQTPYAAFKGKKIIEIRAFQINKGNSVERFLQEQQHIGSFLTAGDDKVDEDMFAIHPDRNLSIYVGYGGTNARFSVESSDTFLTFLERLVKTAKREQRTQENHQESLETISSENALF